MWSVTTSTFSVRGSASSALSLCSGSGGRTGEGRGGELERECRKWVRCRGRKKGRGCRRGRGKGRKIWVTVNEVRKRKGQEIEEK